MFKDARRGDIWYANASMGSTDPDSRVLHGGGPVLVVSNNYNNELDWTVTVVPITSSPRKLAHLSENPYYIEMPASPESGLAMRSCAEVVQITTVDRRALTRWMGDADSDTMTQVAAAARKLLQI